MSFGSGHDSNIRLTPNYHLSHGNYLSKNLKAITTGYRFPWPGTNAWGGILYRQGLRPRCHCQTRPLCVRPFHQSCAEILFNNRVNKGNEYKDNERVGGATKRSTPL